MGLLAQFLRPDAILITEPTVSKHRRDEHPDHIWNTYRHSWHRVVEADLRQLNVGLTSTWRKAAIHDDCRSIVDTALSLSLSLRFNGHFPGEPGLAGVC